MTQQDSEYSEARRKAKEAVIRLASEVTKSKLNLTNHGHLIEDVVDAFSEAAYHWRDEAEAETDMTKPED